MSERVGANRPRGGNRHQYRPDSDTVAANVEVHRHDIGVDELVSGDLRSRSRKGRFDLRAGARGGIDADGCGIETRRLPPRRGLVAPVTEGGRRPTTVTMNWRNRAVARSWRFFAGGVAILSSRTELRALILAVRADRRRRRRLFRPYPYRCGGPAGQGEYRPDWCRDDRDRFDQFGGTGPISRDPGPPGLSAIPHLWR